jgi:hypothetical protein
LRPIKQFKEYIEEQIVKKQSVDKSRSLNLKKESEQTEIFLKQIINKIGINDENANTIIKLVYDILMENIRSKMFLQGYVSSGQGAHEAEVSYLRILNFNERDVQFCDQLRFFRNKIMYYGKDFDKEYAQKTVDFLDKFKKKISEKNKKLE